MNAPSRSSADTARPGSDEQDAPASPAPPQGEREATVEIHIPQYIGRAKSDKLVDAVCRAITKHDIEFTRVKLVHPGRASLRASTPPADNKENGK